MAGRTLPVGPRRQRTRYPQLHVSPPSPASARTERGSLQSAADGAVEPRARHPSPSNAASSAAPAAPRLRHACVARTILPVTTNRLPGVVQVGGAVRFVLIAVIVACGCYASHADERDDDIGVADVADRGADADVDVDGDADAGVDADADVSCAPNTCPSDMVYVPCGPFVMGSDPGEGFAREMPEHVVTLSAYCIDLTEVTAAAYRACMAAGGCTAPVLAYRPDEHPVDHVDWNQMSAYCAWAGKRLPTEAEWEKAARGGCDMVAPETCGTEDERTYPWGEEEPTCSRANYREGTSSCMGEADTVGVRPLGDSPYGVHDMAGNVRELVSDWYGDTYYSTCASGCGDPTGPSLGGFRIIRGGDFMHPSSYVRTAHRDGIVPWGTAVGSGGRCARTP